MHTRFFRWFSLAFLLFSAYSALFPQIFFYENGAKSRPDALNLSSSKRVTLDLSGDWKYSINEGKNWHPVVLPASADFEGKIIFTRKFNVEKELVSNYSFKFVSYGINYSCEIFLNGEFIGKHEGGYTSFDLLIPENALQVGEENVIKIVTDNTLSARSTIPLRQQIWGWKNYGGIFRDLFILATPKIWIDDVAVVVESIDPKSVKIGVTSVISARSMSADQEVNNSVPVTYQVLTEITERATGLVIGKNIPAVCSPQSNKDVQVKTQISLPAARLWNLDFPELYSVRVLLSAGTAAQMTLLDEVNVMTGVRTVAKGVTDVFLNGSPLSLRAVSWIEDSPNHGASVSYEEMERDVALIKNLGANVIRFAFHPPHPFMLQLCDQYGLLAMIEIPVHEIPGEILQRENFRMLAENYLREVIQRDRNHPSVLAWGLGSSCEIQNSHTTALIEYLHSIVKQTDNRLTYYVSRSPEDRTAAAVDLAGVILGESSVKEFKSQLELWIENHPEQPVFVAQYGKPAQSGNRNGYSDPFSQESEARYLSLRFNVIREKKIFGGVVWAFADWRGDRPVLTVPSVQPALYTSGIVELSREKKVAYDIVKSMYSGEKILALPVGTYSPVSPVIYVLLGLVVLIIFAWLLNSNRRFRESVNRSLLRPFNFYADIRDQRVIANSHTVVVAFLVAITSAIVISSILYHYRTNPLFDYVLTHCIDSNQLKLYVIQLIWNPLSCIGAITAIVMLWIVSVIFIIKIGSMAVRARVYFFHSFSVAVWSTVPMVLFIPIGMILYRVMESPAYILPTLIAFALILLWILARTLKGIAIIYDVRPLNIYGIALLTVLLIFSGLYLYFDSTYASVAYARYLLTTIVPTTI